MKNKMISIAVVAVAVLALIFSARSCGHGKAVNKMPQVVKGEKQKAAMPAKKVFAKGMGALTVKIKGSNDKPQYLRAKAFSAEGKNESVFVAAFGSERMQELPSGNYDIEIDTTPAKIYKDINVIEGKETVRDLGAVTGSLNVKALNSKKKEALLTVKIIRPKSNLMVTSTAANKPVEIVPGIYNVDIGTLPRQIKEGVKIEGGKETVLDLGVASGAIIVKALDENGKEARINVQIKNSDNNAIVASNVTNRALDIAPGSYDIEILSAPPQSKKLVKIAAGEETAVEFTVQVPAQQAAPVKKK